MYIVLYYILYINLLLKLESIINMHCATGFCPVRRTIIRVFHL